MSVEPVMVEIKGGWAAVGDGWAVLGVDQAEARAKYAEAERLHGEIAARDWCRPDEGYHASPLDVGRLAEALFRLGLVESDAERIAAEYYEPGASNVIGYAARLTAEQEADR